MRRSRLLLLVLLPAYGLLSLPLIAVVREVAAALAIPQPGMVPEVAAALVFSNLVVFFIVIYMNLLRLDPDVTILAFVASNLAFWLPIAHLVDMGLEKIRRRRARRRSQGSP